MDERAEKKVNEQDGRRNGRKADKLYIVIPAYNEAANIATVVDEWYKMLEVEGASERSRLLVIDDGSKDETFQILKKLKEKMPKLLVVKKPNSGHGATVLYGYQYALNEGADYIFQTDSDGQTRPEEFEEFWKLRVDYDMVIGHRKKRQDGWSRIIVTKVLKLVIQICFGVTVIDANTPFRLMNAAVLKKQMKYVPEGFHLPNVLIAVIYEKKNIKTKYIPITFRPRQGGENSIHLGKICRIGARAFRDFIAINRWIENEKDGECNEY